MYTGGIVLAAGMSSRMGEFKPLMELAGETMLSRAIRSLKEAGVSRVCVVTGRDAEMIRQSLSGLGVSYVHNPDYAVSDMFFSIKLGLLAVMECDSVYILPADMPLVLPETIRELTKYQTDVVIPSFNGKKGHPPLMRKRCYKKILLHNGDMGLKGALENFSLKIVETDDEGTILDADTPEAFNNLKTLLERRSRRV